MVELHGENLFGFVFKYLRDSEDSHDIVQDVFEKLWKNRKKVETYFAKAWMFRTAHNTLINFSNKKKRTVFNSEVVPEKHFQDNGYEIKQTIEKVLSTLPPIQKSIILLRDLEGYSYQEISKILEISEPQVKVYLFRARKKLQKQLKQLAIL